MIAVVDLPGIFLARATPDARCARLIGDHEATAGRALTMTREQDYVLGTHDEEIARLALQHRVWRPRALDAWRRAGFTVGQTLLDIGCGPGHASVDLAEIVGPEGRIVAIDRSRRFLDFLEATRRQRGLEQIATLEQDLDDAVLPAAGADGAWSRWVFAFVKRPRDLLARVGGALKPGGVLVAQEYLDYSTWRLTPRSADFEEFVRVVTESWRASGGEPDIGLDLPRWLEELGFEIRSLRPILEVARPADYLWQWPKAFVDVGLRRLVDLGDLTPDRAQVMAQAFAASEAAPHTLMITPAVLDVIAGRR
jgi:SAM-dependent methyltransferase